MLVLFFLALAIATPPACFLSCVNEVAHGCSRAQTDLECICNDKPAIIACLVDICPLGNFESARDHFLGTCLEHNRPAALFPPRQQPLQQPQGEHGIYVKDAHPKGRGDHDHDHNHNLPQKPKPAVPSWTTISLTNDQGVEFVVRMPQTDPPIPTTLQTKPRKAKVFE